MQTHLPHVFIGEDKRCGFRFVSETFWREACRKIDIATSTHRAISENATVANSKVSHFSRHDEKESDRRRYSLPFPARCCPTESQMRFSWVWVYMPYILITGTIDLYLKTTECTKPGTLSFDLRRCRSLTEFTRHV